MVKRKTPKEYYEECKEKNLDLPIDEYINGRTKIIFKCSKGHIYTQNPKSHLQGRSCPKCAIQKRVNNRKGLNAKKTSQEYYNECKQKNLDLPIEWYVNNSTPIKHLCRICNTTYIQSPGSHLQGRSCPKCGVKKRSNIRTKTFKQYYKECKERGLDLPIEDYINARTKIKHKCKNGHIYMQSPDSHLTGQGCSKCNNNKKKTPQNYYDECKKRGLDLPIRNYVNAITKIKHKCNKGHIYLQSPDKHLQYYGCPICNESHGERFIRNYLDNNNIKYEPQKKFKDLKDKTYLSYDFYLPKQNMLIEYQGEQHYESNAYFGGEKQLELQQLHDKMKKDYAKANGYKLLELHYSLDTQEKVTKYLSRRIKN